LDRVGDTLFLCNKAEELGGAIYVDESANIYAAFGDMVFQGNVHGENGTENAIYFSNYGGATVTLSAFDNHTMRFYDPISSDVNHQGLNIRINGALARRIKDELQIDNLGAWAARQTGTVLFDTFPSDVYFATADVCNGTMVLQNAAQFGASDEKDSLPINGIFTLHPTATLCVAYEQEIPTYELSQDESKIDFSAMEKAFKEKKSNEKTFEIENAAIPTNAINASELNLNGRLHFVIPSDVQFRQALLLIPGLISFSNKTTSVTLETCAKSIFPLNVGDNVVLLHSAADMRIWQEYSMAIFKKNGLENREVLDILAELEKFTLEDIYKKYGIDIKNDLEVCILKRIFRIFKDHESEWSNKPEDATKEMEKLIGQMTAIEGYCSNKTAEAMHLDRVACGVAISSGYLFSIDVDQSSGNLLATYKSPIAPKPVVAPAMQALTNNHLAGLLLMNYGAEVTSALTRSPFDINADRKSSWTLFLIPSSIDRCTYETGANASLRTRAFTFAGGILNDTQLQMGHLRLAEFFDCGVDSYRSRNDFADSEFGPAGTVTGKGDSHNYAFGTVLRMDFDGNGWGHGYCEESCRIGALSSDWKSDGPIDGERLRDRKTSNFVCSGHLAIGYALNEGSSITCDLCGKCSWAHRAGGKVLVNGNDALSFSAIDSVRLRLGASVYGAKNKNFSFRVAAAWEREFDGKAEAAIYEYSLPLSKLKADSAVAEMQLTWRPSSQQDLAIDFGVCGHFAAREGVSAHIRVSRAL
jgi:predicted outer membrane repeat protein